MSSGQPRLQSETLSPDKQTSIRNRDEDVALLVECLPSTPSSRFDPQHCVNLVWWHTPVTLALGRLKKEHQDLKIYTNTPPLPTHST